jgi:hypothetical protein
VDARVVLPPAPNIMGVPATAIQSSPKGDWVYVVADDGTDAQG